ncbi:hypothetical protein ACE1CI_27445 [Aerosakkonemataceae cyanobacterium BLCC-F50]|uniref:Uncharacterized protein n=1 Tax=Floridaenema flaviceps BLCC-F50 TaxID=3153642 RepID=A0ABV4XY46_9CYAN
MQLSDRPLPIKSPTLNTLITELGEECTKVQALIYQLQLTNLSGKQQAEILAELLACAVHLNVHCGEDFQNLIAEEMESLPDDDEA